MWEHFPHQAKPFPGFKQIDIFDLRRGNMNKMKRPPAKDPLLLSPDPVAEQSLEALRAPRGVWDCGTARAS